MITQITKLDYTDEQRDPLTEKIIGCCFEVYSELGPGFNERIYQNALIIALKEAGLIFETEKDFPVSYHDNKAGSLRLDLIVEDRIIIEIKAVTGKLPAIFKYQLLSYLKVTNLRVGLLVNFGNKSCQVKRFMV